MIEFVSKGDWNKTAGFLEKAQGLSYMDILKNEAERGVKALQENTPVDTGLTASSWDYEINKDRAGVEIVWTNTNIQNGINIAILLRYDHGTGTGGFVKGQNYITPAIQPVFDSISDTVWKRVSE